MPMEDGPTLRQDPLKLDLLNEDSSSRKRSSSLTEQVCGKIMMVKKNYIKMIYKFDSIMFSLLSFLREAEGAQLGQDWMRESQI